MTRVTGSIVKATRNRGVVLYLKARVPDPGRPDGYRQIKKLLGDEADWPKKKAEDAKRDWLTDLGRVPLSPTNTGVTFGRILDEWLRDREHECRPSPMSDYRSTAEARLRPFFGADTPIEDVTT